MLVGVDGVWQWVDVIGNEAPGTYYPLDTTTIKVVAPGRTFLLARQNGEFAWKAIRREGEVEY